MNTTMNVTVKYNLSAAGQRAALLAGRCASATVTETMPLEDTSLLDQLTIAADGALSFPALGGHIYGFPAMVLDAPPATVAELIQAYAAYRAHVDEQAAQAAADRTAKEAAVVAERQAAIDRDAPEVASILDELESISPADPLPQGLSCENYQPFLYRRGSRNLTLATTPADMARLAAIAKARQTAKEQADVAKEAAKDAERDALIAQHGGMWWAPQGGMCQFLGYGLWQSGQTKRWVGIFTSPKGISEFLDSPRGEFAFGVSSLAPGDCIQGGGYDTNSRGKRRNESEWFGVVVRNDDTGLVIRQCASRSACFAAVKEIGA